MLAAQPAEAIIDLAARDWRALRLTAVQSEVVHDVRADSRIRPLPDVVDTYDNLGNVRYFPQRASEPRTPRVVELRSGPNFNLYYVESLRLSLYAPIQIHPSLGDPRHPFYAAQPRRGGLTNMQGGRFNLCGQERLADVRALAERHEVEHVDAFVGATDAALAAGRRMP